MVVYFIADTHFGHENIIRFSNRPFTNVEEMNRIMLQSWNARVRSEDDVYIIGDFWFNGGQGGKHYPDEALRFVKQLKGQKHLVVGNHDKKALSDPHFRAEFVEIADIIKISHKGQRVILCHYPMLAWEGSRREAWHIHGHLHARRNEASDYLRTQERALNAAAEIVQYIPATFDELARYNEIFKSQPNSAMLNEATMTEDKGDEPCMQ